jgi:exopolyphosphatase/guanosine-5'-triphosphate,3'-diphosphate pyrophosphatase
VGAVRLTRDFSQTDPISVTEFVSLRAYIRGMLERPIDELRHSLQAGETVRLVGTSGTIETLGIINALNQQREIPNPLQGYQLTRKDLRDWVKRLMTLNYEQRFAIPGLSDKRAEIILAGAVILLEAMTMLNLDTITICERALREGVIVDWIFREKFVNVAL